MSTIDTNVALDSANNKYREALDGIIVAKNLVIVIEEKLSNKENFDGFSSIDEVISMITNLKSDLNNVATDLRNARSNCNTQKKSIIDETEGGENQ